LYKRSNLTFVQEKLLESKNNQKGSICIIILGAFLVVLCFFLPKYSIPFLGPAIVIMGVIIGLVGASESSYHYKEHSEYQALMEQLNGNTRIQG